MCAEPMGIHVVPGQIRWRWCGRCASYAALEVGVYTLAGDNPPDLVGTFDGCTNCAPDLFARAADSPPQGGVDGVSEGAAMTNPTPVPAPTPEPEPDDDRPGF